MFSGFVSRFCSRILEIKAYIINNLLSFINKQEKQLKITNLHRNLSVDINGHSPATESLHAELLSSQEI